MTRSITAGIRTAVGVCQFVWRSPANRGQRGRALLRSAEFQLRSRLLKQRCQATLGQSSKIWTDLHRHSASRVVYANPPDYREMMLWRTWLRPGDCFVDVGANVGVYTLWAAELGARVIAIEPSPDACQLLRENVALNCYQVEVIEAAAWSSSGVIGFTSDQDTENRADRTGDLSVRSITLDAVLRDGDVRGLKVDVEGFEHEVLLGAQRLLGAHRVELIQLEWNVIAMGRAGTRPDAVVEGLREFGYQLYRPDDQGRLVRVSESIEQGPDVFALCSMEDVVLVEGLPMADVLSDKTSL